MAHILVVDDETKIGRLLASELSDAGHKATAESDPTRALAVAEKTSPDVLITDLRMDGMDGITLMKRVREASPSTDVIVMTAYASVETALETMKQGAYDYIIKPFSTEELLLLVSRLDERRRLRDENEGLRRIIATTVGEDIIGKSSAIGQVRKLIENLGASDAAVLIRGESGTGKELVARAIHKASPRRDAPFVALNCAAIPESLLESELFGHEKGAFTGALRRKPGHFQAANTGTLFLDEIGDLPAALQAKLLRVLEDKRVTPLGSETPIQLDLRLVSATHRPLEEAIAEGTFREDLFYRLNVFPIVLPPLRDRSEDILPIAQHFLSNWGRDPGDLGTEALARLVGYRWPGNIRELRNILERATILRPNGTITADDIMTTEGATPLAEASFTDTLNLADAEKSIILRALDAARGNKSEAARLLGITRRALYGRLDRYGIDHD